MRGGVKTFYQLVSFFFFSFSNHHSERRVDRDRRAGASFVVTTRRAFVASTMGKRVIEESEDEHSDDNLSDAEDPDDPLHGKDLYELIGVSKSASSGEIKKAYHKMALKLHPDKNPSEDAAVQFQTLQKVYGVLSDADKRRVYDETGRFDDADGLSDEKFNSLYEYYRGIYKQVTEEDIESFELEYRGGDEEKKDLLEAYEKFAGNMSKVFMWVMCSEEAVDSHRFADVVDAAVDAGESKRYPAFTSWAAKIRKKPAPKDPLKPRPKKKKKAASAGGGGEGDLMAIIQARQNARAAAADDLFARLEEKYGGGKSPKKKAKGGGKKK